MATYRRLLDALLNKLEKPGVIRSVAALVAAIICVTLGHSYVPNGVQISVVVAAAGINLGHFAFTIPAKWVGAIKAVATDVAATDPALAPVATAVETVVQPPMSAPVTSPANLYNRP